jgi:hypothetical protein
MSTSSMRGAGGFGRYGKFTTTASTAVAISTWIASAPEIARTNGESKRIRASLASANG